MATTEQSQGGRRVPQPEVKPETPTQTSPGAQEDEFYEAFDSERIARMTHPNLGFKSKAALEATKNGLILLSGHPDVSAKVMGKYQGLLDEQGKHVGPRETRRTFLTWALGLGAGATAVFAGVSAIQEYQRNQDFLRRQALERYSTLGSTPPSPSAYGWTVRYLDFDQSNNYTETQVMQIGEGASLDGPTQSVWSQTGIKVYSHRRTTDDIEVPKLRIANKVDTSGYPTSSEEWILKTPEETRNSRIDSRVVILEKRDEALLQPIALSLSIRKVDGNKPFEVRIMRPQKVTPY